MKLKDTNNFRNMKRNSLPDLPPAFRNQNRNLLSPLSTTRPRTLTR
ncbi:MAG: hypothetical protein NTW79_01035 [Candidatus Berkelbacteria bacterium]|nr:hypothetical protein [Candidatus Berkelbacteria bacterium]